MLHFYIDVPSEKKKAKSMNEEGQEIIARCNFCFSSLAFSERRRRHETGILTGTEPV